MRSAQGDDASKTWGISSKKNNHGGIVVTMVREVDIVGKCVLNLC